MNSLGMLNRNLQETMDIPAQNGLVSFQFSHQPNLRLRFASFYREKKNYKPNKPSKNPSKSKITLFASHSHGSFQLPIPRSIGASHHGLDRPGGRQTEGAAQLGHDLLHIPLIENTSAPGSLGLKVLLFRWESKLYS